MTDTFQAILRKIPGFGGYVSVSARQNSEAKARQWVADHLESGKRAVDRFAKTLAEGGHLDLLPRCDRVRGQLDLLIARMRSTPLGRSSFFSDATLDNEQLEDLYEYDLWLMDEAEKLAKSVETIATGSEVAAPSLQALEQQVAAMASKWADRQKVIED